MVCDKREKKRMRIIYCVCDTFIKYGNTIPAQCPEPGQIIGMVNAVADGDDLMEALDLNTEDLSKEKHQRACANIFLLV